ncbi:MAG: exonuclease SbcCD subunit D [Dysgonamonadaceae bacterium]|nr:exonuclease SbcCD subunit D [Dysgonamonadaceae bacterium]
MKLLHTSDWHIGQTFHGYDRKKEHLVFLDRLKAIIQEKDIDVLLVAGDIFDTPNPSAESQKIFYRFLKEINRLKPDLQTIIIAGNHDSAGRLEAPNPLLEEMNIIIRGNAKKLPGGEIDYDNLIVPLKENEGYCFCLPYLRQGDYPEAETYSQGVQAFIKEMSLKITDDKPIVVMAHLYASGAELSADDYSERTIAGGIECISSRVFDRENIVYVALGHLHKAQIVGKKEFIRYAGSSLPMSFSEKFYSQGVNCFEIKNNQLFRFERIEFDTPVKLLSIPSQAGDLNDVLTAIEQLPAGEITDFSPFLEVKVRMKEPDPSLKYKLEEALKHKAVRLASLKAVFPEKKQETILRFEDLKSIHPVEMAEDIFVRRYGEKMPEKMKNLLVNLIKELEV